jgi:hypothetical protein
VVEKGLYIVGKLSLQRRPAPPYLLHHRLEQQQLLAYQDACCSKLSICWNGIVHYELSEPPSVPRVPIEKAKAQARCPDAHRLHLCIRQHMPEHLGDNGTHGSVIVGMPVLASSHKPRD